MDRDVEELSWIQRYAASEVVEHAAEGRLTRREMLGRLAAICGSAAAGAAFLAACGDDGADPGGQDGDGPSTTGGGSGEGASTVVEAPTTEGDGATLSVAEDDTDVEGEDVTFDGPASDMLGYLARPAASGSRPGIIVIHEIFGLTDHIRDVTRRLAKAGYLALAVDLASREGGTDEADDAMGAITGGTDEERVADLRAGVAYLEEQDDFNGHLGVVGFCFGGGMTLALAAAEPKVEAAVPYYGPTPDPASRMSATEAAILAHYGETDERVNAGIEPLEEALEGKTFEKHVHEGAGHAFNNDTGDNYNEEAAVTAWNETLAWFGDHLA
jgi:carboxymethylenebutenolidase